MKAYITVVSNNNFIPGTIGLIRSLLYVKTCYPIVVGYTKEVDIKPLKKYPVELVRLTLPELPDSFLKAHSTENIHKNPFSGVKPSFHSTVQNFIKLTIWKLTKYKKAIYLDSDIIIIKNIDELFEYPCFSAAPNLYTNIIDLNRMNSGVFVFKPDNKTYENMLKRLSIPDAFYKRTDQTFLQEFFPDWQGLPYIYNTLQYFYFRIPQIWKWENIKVIHYQYEKPWDTGHSKLDILADLIKIWRYIYEDGKIPSSFINNLKNPKKII